MPPGGTIAVRTERLGGAALQGDCSFTTFESKRTSASPAMAVGGRVRSAPKTLRFWEALRRLQTNGTQLGTLLEAYATSGSTSKALCARGSGGHAQAAAARPAAGLPPRLSRAAVALAHSQTTTDVSSMRRAARAAAWLLLALCCWAGGGCTWLGPVAANKLLWACRLHWWRPGARSWPQEGTSSMTRAAAGAGSQCGGF